MRALIGILPLHSFYRGFYIWCMDFRYTCRKFRIHNFTQLVFSITSFIVSPNSIRPLAALIWVYGGFTLGVGKCSRTSAECQLEQFYCSMGIIGRLREVSIPREVKGCTVSLIQYWIKKNVSEFENSVVNIRYFY